MASSAVAGARSVLARPVIVVLASLLLGFAVGTVLSTVAASRGAPRITDSDYVLMVADLYDHEKSVFNARERLTLIGKSPSDLAEVAANDVARSRPEARRDVDSLRQLSQALRLAETDGTARSESPGLIALLVLVAASVAIAAGLTWVWKLAETRGLRLPHVPRPSALRRIDLSRLFPRGQSDLVSVAASPAAAPAEPRPETRVSARLSVPVRQRNHAVTAALAPERDRLADEPRIRVVTRSERAVHASTYQIGDDPFDDIFPIVDSRGEMIGACGVSATEASDRAGRYYGFTAWLQDYSGGSELSAVGLVTRAGELTRGAALAEWRRRGTIDDVQRIDKGLELALRTRFTDAHLIVEDFDYVAPTEGSPGYFARLSIRFEVETAA